VTVWMLSKLYFDGSETVGVYATEEGARQAKNEYPPGEYELCVGRFELTGELPRITELASALSKERQISEVLADTLGNSPQCPDALVIQDCGSVCTQCWRAWAEREVGK